MPSYQPVDQEKSVSPSIEPLGSGLEPSVESDILAFAQGDSQARERLLERRHIISQEDRKIAAEKNAETGRSGEELINAYFAVLREAKKISDYEWVSSKNAVAPYDFWLTDASGEELLLDVKSTLGKFGSRLYISTAELRAMAESAERYDLYRVYELTEQGGKLRIAQDMRNFAREILNTFRTLPNGINAEGISADPKRIDFGKAEEFFFESARNFV